MPEIYLLSLDGRSYAVLKDEVEDVFEVETIHHLPFSPAGIVGLAVVEKQHIALADIAALLGLSSFSPTAVSRVILVAGQDNGAGFVFGGDFSETSVPDESILMMPGYVATPEISTCAILNNKPVPVLDLGALYRHLNSQDLSPARPAFSVPAVAPTGGGTSGLVFIVVGGETLALPAEVITEIVAAPTEIVRIPLAPRSLPGITFSGGRVIPVVDLAARLNLPNRPGEKRVLLLKIGGDYFGFLVDSEGVGLVAADFSVQPLPPLAESPFVKAVAIFDGVIIPLINPVAILAKAPAGPDSASLGELYPPGSEFDLLCHRQDVEVVEFKLLGVRHAIPEIEVREVLPFAPFSKIPGLRSLVVGVVEHLGEIVPVLDLALVFGRRSFIGADWSMVLVDNGNFRAFVITAEVFPKRKLPLHLQKKVPVTLPNRLVYGCYPDDNLVRLIVNVRALAVHFDKMIVKNFLSSLTREMASTASEIVHDLLPPEEVLRLKDEEIISAVPVNTSVEVASEIVDSVEPPTNEIESGDRQNDLVALDEMPAEGLIHNLEQLDGGPEQVTDGVNMQSETHSPQLEVSRCSVSAAGLVRESDESNLLYVDSPGLGVSQAPLPAAGSSNNFIEQTGEPISAEGLAAGPAEQFLPFETAGQGSEGLAEVEEDQPGIVGGAEPGSSAALDMVEPQVPDKLIFVGDENSSSKRAGIDRHLQADLVEKEARVMMQAAMARQYQRQEEFWARPGREEKAKDESENLLSSAAEKNRAEREQQKLAEMLAILAEDRTDLKESRTLKEAEEEKARVLAEFRGRKKQSKNDHKRLLVLAALLLLLLIDLSIFYGIPGRKPDNQGIRENGLVEDAGSGKSRQVKSLPGVAEPGPEGESVAGLSPEEPPHNTINLESRPKLKIIVPVNMPMITDTYLVKSGDTLWDISKRFTGTPYNYPAVAQENKISDPDLIFPGQTILLEREKNVDAPGVR